MSSPSNQLIPGDIVEVRPWSEIRTTLDDNGMREGLAFMPEMLKYCGRRFVVSKWIAGNEGLPFGSPPHIRNVVVLSGLHCDGAAHSGCSKACVLCWKQEWLTKVNRGSAEQAISPATDAPSPVFPYKRADGRYPCQCDEVVLVERELPRQKPVSEDRPSRIQKLSLDGYAAFQRTMGQKVVNVEGFWWRQVRPCFYRPLLPFREFSATSSGLPSSAWLGGVQYVVPCGQRANSTMSFLIFPDAGDYSLDTLRSKPRYQVRWAMERFTIRPFADRNEFKQQAYPVYTSFYARTRYNYLAERLKKANFDKWADAVFAHQPSLVLGAWRGAELCAVSIAHAVGDALIYSTSFAMEQALRDHVSSLMLHTVRSAAREEGSIAQVYVGMPKTAEARGVDDFLTRRGCRVVTKPALLRLNPASRCLVRCFLPSEYARMRGDGNVPGAVAAEDDRSAAEAGFTKVAWRRHFLTQAGPRNLFRLAAKNTLQLDHFYILGCNLSALPAGVPKRLGGGEVRLLLESEVQELFDLLHTLDSDDRRELLARLRFWTDGFKHCYVLRINGEIAYMQWLVYPSENDLIRRYHRRRFRLLGPCEVMIENAFTHPKYRGWGLLPSVTVELLQKAKEQGFKQAVSYVRKDRIVVLNHFAQAGFRITKLAREFRVLGCVWRQI